jgi:hypothetical protein
LNDALQRSARSSEGAMAVCFHPRHGIRVTRGDTVTDVVICFECYKVQVFANGQRAKGFLITDVGQGEFDEVLTKAGVTLAGTGK